ncbi:MAG: fucose isomerase [Lentisphaeria bacterium]
MNSALPKLKLGLCPIGKFVFSHEDAIRQKQLLETKLRALGVTFCTIDAAVTDGVVRSTEDAAKAIACLQAQKIDALFLVHGNFGTEHAVGLIGQALNVPAAVWGPRDEAPLANGERLRDTLCGMFAATKVLHTLGVPFSYLENCRLDEPAFAAGLDRFLRAAAVANLFRRGLRIAHVGQRIDFFWSTIINEAELLQRFNTQIIPVDLVPFLRKAKARAARDHKILAAEVKDLHRQFKVEAPTTDEGLLLNLAVRDQLLEEAGAVQADAVAVQDFMSLVEETNGWCMLATSMVSDRLPYGLESDIHGAITCAMLARAAGAGAAFLADITVRHPANDNGVLIWHAGAPLSMRHPDDRGSLGGHWILKGPYGGMPHFRLRDGEVTLARFDGGHGRYQLAVGEGRTIDGPYTLNNYAWVEVADWPVWERTLMEGPFIHHAGMAYGRYAGALAEACRFIPGLEPVRLP